MTTLPKTWRVSYGQRMGLAALAAFIGLILLAILGPDEQGLQDWLFHTGAKGELRILPEIQIIQDENPHTQKEKRTMAGASQGLQVEVVDRPQTPPAVDAKLPSPARKGIPDPSLPSNSILRHEKGQLDDERNQIRMVRPSQQSLDFILVKLVRPEYPRKVPRWLRAKTVVVDVAIYVEADGRVSDAYILRGEGGELFANAVLKTVRQWEYRYIGAMGKEQPFWDQVRWIFQPRSSGNID